MLFFNRFLSIFLVVLIWEIFLTHTHAGPLPSALNNLSGPDRAALAQAAADRNTGILVTDDHGQVLFSRNADTPRVPASILKVLTSLAALEHLGPEYRFLTRAAYDPGTRTLWVQGLGDPLFVSEVIRDFCGRCLSRKMPINIFSVQCFFQDDFIIFHP